MGRFHKALPNIKSAYVTLQNFTPDFKNIYTDISAVSVTLCNSAPLFRLFCSFICLFVIFISFLLVFFCFLDCAHISVSCQCTQLVTVLLASSSYPISIQNFSISIQNFSILKFHVSFLLKLKIISEKNNNQ